MTTVSKEKSNIEECTITRKIVFSNYRNLGIGKEQSLTINNRADKDSLGELIIVIGGNNTGKTNVLDGLLALTGGIDEERDVPDFIFKDIDTRVKLTLSSGRTWTYTRGTKETSLSDGSKKIPFAPMPEKFDYEMSKELLNFLTRPRYNSILKTIEAAQIINTDLVNELAATMSQNWMNTSQTYSKFIDEINKYNQLAQSYNEALEKSHDCAKTITEFNQKILGETGCPLLPNIIRYQEEKISQVNMKTSIADLSQSKFFTKIFNLLNIEIAEILTCCERVNSNKISASALTKLEREMNVKLDKFSKQFNKMYTFDNNEYAFAFKLETEKVLFTISYADVPLNIDRQSTGFRWFFDFYLNLLNEKNLTKGDIIIMDEPATNLHVRGMVELRNFLKQYAKQSGITFILSTHSPFLIDIDHLDELRIIKHDNENAIICNDFTLEKNDTKDALFDILGSLTVGRHILLNPNDPLIFVEGLTDYNYLVAFKEFFAIEDKKEVCINFLPINGLKDKNLIKKLCDIVKDPVLLVDNDEAGSITEIKNKKSHGKINIINLGEVDKSIKTIEEMFVGKDRGFVSEKHNANSRNFKNSFNEIVKNLSSETIENFRKLFDICEVL